MKSDFPKQAVLNCDEDGVLVCASPECDSPHYLADGEEVGIYKLESVMVVRKEARFEPLAAKPAKKGVGREKAKK